MEILQAILLGVIEGLTEFLPISSTGHLIIAQEHIGFRDKAKIFTVVIQSGAILAVIWYYRKDLAEKIKGFFGGQRQDVNFFRNLAIAAAPAGLMGLFLNEEFKGYATPKVVATALILGAGVLWLADKKSPPPTHEEKIKMDKLSAKQALIVGLAQCFALIPGVSRSGASIVGGLISGMNRVTATAFSFYLSIPLLGAASLYKLAVDGSELSSISGGVASIVAGAAAAFIVALLAISWLLKYISSHSFKLFVYYRLVLGIVVLVLLV